MKMMWARINFFPDNIFSLVFLHKKFQIPKILSTWVFMNPKFGKIFWDFAAGMDFERNVSGAWFLPKQ